MVYLDDHEQESKMPASDDTFNHPSCICLVDHPLDDCPIHGYAPMKEAT